jgi:hypothetical protein
MCKKNYFIHIRHIFIIFLALGVTYVSAQNQKGDLPGNFIRSYKSMVFGNPSADLDQCANGAVGGVPVICSGTAWQNGNLGHSQAHYLEGESVPYRLRFGSLTPGTVYTVTIEFDTTENSGAKHAIDYLTDFDASEVAANPCSNVPGCNLAVNDTFPIPVDPNVAAGHDGIPGTGDDITQIAGDFTLFNGQINDVSTYTLTGTYTGASQTKVTITFRATASDPVLAWGGHISTRVNWGTDNSAIAISGSPYHMRLLDLNGAGGNQDRSLSSAATIFPGKITIIKDARPNTDQIFGFTTTGPGVANFSLVDDGSGMGNSQLFDNLTNFGAANAVAVTEDLPSGNYHVTQINCLEDASGGGGQQNSTVDIPLRTANIILEEGESVTCTYVNAVPTAAADAIVSGRIQDIDGRGVTGISVSLTGSNGVTRASRTNSFGYYRFAELPVGESYVIQVSSRRYTFSTDTRIIMLMGDLSDQDFTAIPIN